MWSITVIILSAIVLGSMLILSLAEKAIELRQEREQQDWLRERAYQDGKYARMLKGGRQ